MFEAGFNCPHCDAYSHMSWFHCRKIRWEDGTPLSDVDDLTIGTCVKCGNNSLWLGDKEDPNNARMLFPIASNAPMAAEDMPVDAKEVYTEARNIVNYSPRAAAALLRLAVQLLMPHLGEKGKNLNTDIGNLVKEGLPEKIQKSLDGVRVIGNNAVHPGVIDINEDPQTALVLFDLINIIVESTITQDKKVDQVYSKLPPAAKNGIEKRNRDNDTDSPPNNE